MLAARRVRALEQLAPRRRPRAGRGARPRGSCQPVIRPSTARRPRSGAITREVQPSPDATVPSGRGNRLERAHDRRADRDHAPAPAVHGVRRAARCARARGSTRGTGARRAPARRRRCAATIGATRTPVRDEPRDQLARERPAGARRLGAARLERVDVLVGLERPLARHVAVADRPAVAAQVAVERLAAARARRARAGGRPRRARGCAPRAAVRQREALAGARRRLKRSAPQLAQLDQPAGRAGAGVESRSSSAVPSRAARGDGRGKLRRGVDDEQVARRAGSAAARGSARARCSRRSASRPSGGPRRGAGRAPRAARAPRSAAEPRSRSRRPRPSGARPARRPRAVAPARAASPCDQREQPGNGLLGLRRGRRCPRRGTPPGASACACRPGRRRRRAARDARRARNVRRAARARPSRSRSRPSPRRARPRRRT